MGKSIVPLEYRRKFLSQLNLCVYDEAYIDDGILVRLPHNKAEWRGAGGNEYMFFSAKTFYQLREDILIYFYRRSIGQMAQCGYCGKRGFIRKKGFCSTTCLYNARVKERQHQSG
jgi:hypothetical protein